jgi:hypothetical protein
MNLFYNPSLSEFQDLFRKTGTKEVHHLVVDYDGEVLIDPHLEQPGLDLNKFKVKMRLSRQRKEAIEKESGHLLNLFDNILNTWEHNNT